MTDVSASISVYVCLSLCVCHCLLLVSVSYTTNSFSASVFMSLLPSLCAVQIYRPIYKSVKDRYSLFWLNILCKFKC